MESGFSRYFDGKREVFGHSRISKIQKSPANLMRLSVVNGGPSWLGKSEGLRTCMLDTKS